MPQDTLYIFLLLITFCSTAHIRTENYDETSINKESIGDCLIENITYSNGSKVPSPGPCEECHCQSSTVICSMIKCKPNISGCKVIQQANQCCPQYKCENHNSGGNNGGSTNSTNVSGKREMQPWLLTVTVNNQTSSMAGNMDTQPPNKYPQTIKIIEILPTQNPQVINLNPKETPVLITPNIVDDVKLISSEEDLPEEVASTTEFISESFSAVSQEDKEEAVKNEENLFSSLTPDETDFSQFEEKVKENKTDNVVEGEPTTIINDVENESITLINDDGNIEPSQGHEETISHQEQHITSQREQQSEFVSKEELEDEKEIKVTVNISEGHNMQSDMPNRPYIQNDQRLTEIHTGSEGISAFDNTSEELTTEPNTGEEGNTEESVISNEKASTIPETDNEYTINSIYNKASPTESIISEYIISEKIKEPVKKSDQTVKYKDDNNFLKTVSSPEKHDDQSSTPESEEHTNNNENVSPEKYPDSHSYTTILPDKFDSNLIEFNTDNSYLDTTEGSGFDLISGWTYSEPTSEVNEAISSTNQPQSHPESSSEEYSSSAMPELTGISSTVSISEEKMYTPESLPTVNPHEVSHNKESDEDNSSSEQNTSANDESISREYITEFEDHLHKSTITFPSILKLHDQIQFLKIVDQGSPVSKETTPIATIGIYNPKRPNDLGNLVTVVKENNLQLEQQMDEEKAMAKQDDEVNFTPHILLTPEDLKTLAEILIQEKIMPTYENDERSTNSLEQRSISTQEIDSNESTEKKEETTANYTKNEEDNSSSSESSEESSEEELNSTTTTSNYSDIYNLVEIINVNKMTSKSKEEMTQEETTTTMKAPVNLTDKEKWAQEVLDHIVSNILLPIQGIEIVPRENKTETENNTSSDSAKDENDVTTITVEDIATTELNQVENITDSKLNQIENITLSNNNTDVDSTTKENITESTETSEIKEKEEDSTNSGDIKKDVEQIEISKSTTSQDLNMSRQSRIPSQSRLVNPQLSTSMLDDKDLILLHNFFKKNLSSK